MNNEIRLIIKVPYLYLSYNVSFSTDLTLLDNIILLNDLINSIIIDNSLIIVEDRSGAVLELSAKVKKLNLLEGMTLIIY